MVVDPQDDQDNLDDVLCPSCGRYLPCRYCDSGKPSPDKILQYLWHDPLLAWNRPCIEIRIVTGGSPAPHISWELMNATEQLIAQLNAAPRKDETIEQLTRDPQAGTAESWRSEEGRD